MPTSGSGSDDSPQAAGTIPMRRRLTVGQQVTCKGGSSVSEAELEDAEKIKEAGFSEIFEEAARKESRAVSITSKTDSDDHRRPSFKDKDEEVLSNCEDSKEQVASWVNSCGIAWKCHKGLKPESPNQDSFSILLVENDFALYCVYDGHGPNGHHVSDISRNFVVRVFLQRIQAGDPPKTAFETAFDHGQRMFMELTDSTDKSSGKEGTDASMSGTTCTMAYHDMAKKKIFIAHVGDSRAVLAHRPRGKDKLDAEDMTEDHKPNLPGEKARIEAAGGRVVFDGYYNHRVFAKGGMYPGLNMSRALGDCVGHKEAGLSAMPDVREVDITKYDGDLLLLLCTDGVWEFLDSENAATMAMNGKDLQKAMGQITQKSWEAWMQDSDSEISDDITGIAVLLQSSSS